MAVLFDSTPRSIVVFCTDCVFWSEIVTTGPRTAERIAREHGMDVHPGEGTLDTLDKRNQRARVSAG